MRELTHVEMEMVDGGNPVAIVAVVATGVIVLAGIGLLAYAVYNDCSGSVEFSDAGLKIQVTCPAN